MTSPEAMVGHGYDLEIARERTVDLRLSGVVVMAGDPAGELSDPWRSDVWSDRADGTVSIEVCHNESLARPVRVEPAGCGCDDTSCEYSHRQDGYEVRFLPRCSESHQGYPPEPEEILGTLSRPLRDYPKCPEHPCIVLVEVRYDADDTITAVGKDSCRRLVVSLAEPWTRCAVVKVDAVIRDPAGPYVPGTAEAKGIKVTVSGRKRSREATADFGDGVFVRLRKVVTAGKTLQFTVDIGGDAPAGAHALTVTNPHCSSTTFPDALKAKAAT